MQGKIHNDGAFLKDLGNKSGQLAEVGCISASGVAIRGSVLLSRGRYYQEQVFFYSCVTDSALRQAGVTPSSIPHAGTREQPCGPLHADQVLQRLTLLTRGES